MLNEEEGPMKKIKLLDDVGTLILECIDDFWRGVPVDQSNLVVAAEEMMPIYIFIVLKSKMKDLFAHVSFIREFITDDVKKKHLGYQLSTYESALMFLQDNPDVSELKSRRKLQYLRSSQVDK